ncbi:hypothetical protein PP707_01955 [Acetobacter pasteurianus]|nr:hypothetical protein [Acetobacter pasteurianus]
MATDTFHCIYYDIFGILKENDGVFFLVYRMAYCFLSIPRTSPL